MALNTIAIGDANRGGQPGAPRRRPALNYALWTIQILLALLFLFAGWAKLATPVATMAEHARAAGQEPLSGSFLHFIGIVEMLGGLGLLLPGLLRIRTGLTPLAAAGLVILMTGATVITLRSNQAGTAAIPFVAGALAAFVAYGRWRLAPLRARSGGE